MANILLIEDDTSMRSILRQLLSREGHEVVEASDGEEGIRLFREKPAGLVITDIIMPNKEGIETIKAILDEYEDAKIIAMSGGGTLGPDGYLQMAKAFGAKDVLTKPFGREDLVKTVRNVLERH